MFCIIIKFVLFHGLFKQSFHLRLVDTRGISILQSLCVVGSNIINAISTKQNYIIDDPFILFPGKKPSVGIIQPLPELPIMDDNSNQIMLSSEKIGFSATIFPIKLWREKFSMTCFINCRLQTYFNFSYISKLFNAPVEVFRCNICCMEKLITNNVQSL